VLLATKAFGRMGPGVHDVGLSHQHLIKACEDSLRRLGTDYLDLYQVHGFDALTPVEETLRALDDLQRAGKVRYVGCSNFSGWHLMKSLAISEREGLVRYVGQQVYYSLRHRDTENELIPLGLDQGVGILVWSPLSFGLLAGATAAGRRSPMTRA
jgi:aryl-alcohol dehydrogenase-like predicted oxidoreductase